jgi:gamma-glutamyl-gamma-aminobutyraldehyde dehydrogenase
LDQATIDALRTHIIPDQTHLIDGQNIPAQSGKLLDVFSPIDGTRLTGIAAGTQADADHAVAAARRTFEAGTWAKQPPSARKKVLMRLADLIEAEALALTILGVRDNGTEIAMALKAEAMSCAGTFRYYAEAIDKTYGEIAPTASGTLGLIHREPVGVVAAIVPWNFPLMIGAWKIAPALAAGNSVVLKPGESASLSLLRLGALAHEAGLPDGALNVVTGTGPEVGAALALSMDVAVLAFTGSGGTGRRLLEYSAQSNMKRVYLELGGKSPNVVFADTPDLDRAAQVTANGIFRNAGQVCVAGSRLIVESNIHDDFVAAVQHHAEAMRVGDPLSVDTDIGAVHSDAQLQIDLTAVTRAQSEGASLITGGTQILQGSGGTYMAPTILSRVPPQSDLFQREVFGPVLSVTAFDTEDEAIALANGTDLGLAAGVFTGGLSRAHRMIAAIRSGVVHVNTYGGADMTVPLSGHKQSGNGSDKSLHALEKYQDLKTAWIAL